MSNSELFNPKESLVYDPWESILIKDWIVNYARFSKISPEFSERFLNKPHEFKMVPVPVALFESLGNIEGSGVRMGASDLIPQKDSGFSDPIPYFQEKIARLETFKHYEPLAKLILEFSTFLEKGDIENAMNFISTDYNDFRNRDKKILKKDIQNLFKLTDERKLILTNAEEFVIVGEKVCAKIAGAWKATIKEKSQAHSETFKLEVFFKKDSADWKICSIELV